MRAPAGLLLPALAALALIAACGSSPDGAPSPRDGGSPDAARVVPDDAGAAADADASATQDDGGEDGGGADTGAPDANGPPFACGPSLVCYEVTQFCSYVTGPHGGTFYDCNAPPASCVGSLSCACLAAQGVVSPCVEADGGITVTATE